MGIYILAAIYIYVLLGLLVELLSFITSKEFRDHINDAPVLHTLLYAFCGFPLTIISIVEAASEWKKENTSEKTEKYNSDK